jgi:hypothetical protein
MIYVNDLKTKKCIGQMNFNNINFTYIYPKAIINVHEIKRTQISIASGKSMFLVELTEDLENLSHELTKIGDF